MNKGIQQTRNDLQKIRCLNKKCHRPSHHKKPKRWQEYWIRKARNERGTVREKEKRNEVKINIKQEGK